MGFSSKASGRNTCGHPDFSPETPFWTSGLQNDELVNVCCFRPLSWWSFVTAAKGTKVGPKWSWKAMLCLLLVIHPGRIMSFLASECFSGELIYASWGEGEFHRTPVWKKQRSTSTSVQTPLGHTALLLSATWLEWTLLDCQRKGSSWSL